MSEIRKLTERKTPQGGVIRLEQWPEGYVLWYHGRIAFKSWEFAPEDEAMPRFYTGYDNLTLAPVHGAYVAVDD